MRVVAYCRVSVGNGNGDSLEAQEQAIRAWAEEEGHKIVSVERDEGLSGTKDETERPGLARALALIQEEEADCLCVHRLDRLARALHVQESVLGLVWKAGGRVFSAVDGEVLRDDPDDPMRTFVRQVMGASAQLERGMIRARMQGGRKRRRARGFHIGGRRPYGFLLQHDRRLLPQEEEQDAIRLMEELRKEGRSLREIAAHLEEHNLPAPNGQRWHANTVHRILRRR